jgi:NAD(P)H dehydrogenase (quinone)
MFAITGITGKVGGQTARRLLDAQQPIRAIVRDLNNGAYWAERGCEIAGADMGDAESLARPFWERKESSCCCLRTLIRRLGFPR